ncbi:hypothetical protein ACEXTD_003119 [Salmonella enterica]
MMDLKGFLQELFLDFNGHIQDVFSKGEPLVLVLIAVPVYIAGLIMIGTLFTCNK